MRAHIKTHTRTRTRHCVCARARTRAHPVPSTPYTLHPKPGGASSSSLSGIFSMLMMVTTCSAPLIHHSICSCAQERESVFVCVCARERECACVCVRARVHNTPSQCKFRVQLSGEGVKCRAGCCCVLCCCVSPKTSCDQSCMHHSPLLHACSAQQVSGVASPGFGVRKGNNNPRHLATCGRPRTQTSGFPS